MGILNLTPDSFSDGGRYATVDAALQRALAMVEEGADIIDIGGESSRPGAQEVSLGEELGRVLPVIRAIRRHSKIPISIDTRKAVVAEAALEAGADWINDISAGTHDPEMRPLMARAQVPVVLMHMRGTPETMAKQTEYQDVVSEVCAYLRGCAEELKAQGVRQIILDPGLGFAKTPEQNLQLLRQISELKGLAYPLLIGASRKSFIQKTLCSDSSNVLEGSLAIASYCMMNRCDILRVHDVAETVRVRTVLESVLF